MRTHVEQPIGTSAPMNEREITTLVHGTITRVASEQPGLTIFSIQAQRGWGDILFVRIRASLADRSACEQMEQRFASAVRHELVGQRTSVAVSWSDEILRRVRRHQA